MKNVAKNFFYQSIFQISKILIPIITIPIVSKALGPTGLGLYNYTNSIVQYFVLVAGLGVGIYGNREIALTLKKNKQRLSNVFWEIFFYKGMISGVALLLFLVVSTFSEHRLILYAQSLTIVAVLLDISWFFMGIEDFKKTSLSNLFIQVITFILIIFFVKKPSDVLIYTIIQASGILLSQVIIWPFTKQYIHFVKVTVKECLGHARQSIEFFIPQVSIILYTNLNKTILGIVLGSAAVGYFSNSLQLNNVIVTVITTLDIVLLPYMTGLFASDHKEKIIQTMDVTLHVQLFFSIPLMFGMLTIYDKLVPWFFGNEFLFINQVIPLFSILIVIIPLGMSVARQYLMPVGKIRKYNQSVIIGAVINVTLNLILLPMIGFFGVVIANIVAEIFVTLVRCISFVKDTSFKFQGKKIAIFIFAGILMSLITRFITKDFPPIITTTILQVGIGLTIYLTITTILKSNPILDLLKRKFKN